MLCYVGIRQAVQNDASACDRVQRGSHPAVQKVRAVSFGVEGGFLLGGGAELQGSSDGVLFQWRGAEEELEAMV